jgi:hypothetical protein
MLIGAEGAVRDVVGIRCGALSGNMKISCQAADEAKADVFDMSRLMYGPLKTAEETTPK